MLHKESQARHQQYQQAYVNSFQSNAGASDAHGFGAAPNAVSTYDDAPRGYAASHYDSYGERAELSRGGAKGRGFGSRGRYTGGRAYNSRGRYF